MTTTDFIEKYHVETIFNAEEVLTKDEMLSDLNQLINDEIERRIGEFKEQELPDRNIPYHFEAEISAGLDAFLNWLKSKLLK